MIEKTIKAYYCEYCKKFYRSKSACEKHELICDEHPDNKRACRGCSYNQAKNIEIYDIGDEGKELYDRVWISFCHLHNMAIYPPIVERKKNWFDLPEFDNVPMRKECKDRTESVHVSLNIRNDE